MGQRAAVEVEKEGVQIQKKYQKEKKKKFKEIKKKLYFTQNQTKAKEAKIKYLDQLVEDINK